MSEPKNPPDALFASIVRELSLWLSDPHASRCGRFMLHHSRDLGYVFAQMLGEPKHEPLSIVLVLQSTWDRDTWRLIPCCASMGTKHMSVAVADLANRVVG
jgi:hypothetical protein